ncbi:MAG TPA: hypothetical protein VE224_14935 [Pseudolabrys sp.]|jgi:exonuclease VII small subunit|nr:hypothetical protein [Pseudolabrys sp.]
MANKIEDLEKLLSELTTERDGLEAAIDTMIGDMAATDEDQRRSGEWAPDGAATRRYLQCSTRLAEVEQAIVDASRELAAARKPAGSEPPGG